jgi:hypothetical protein
LEAVPSTSGGMAEITVIRPNTTTHSQVIAVVR